VLTEIGGADPPREVPLEIILTEIGGVGGGMYHTPAGALAQGSTWRSMFTRVRPPPDPRRTTVLESNGSLHPLEVVLPQVRGGRGSFYHRGCFCPQCVYLPLDVHERKGLAF
jgi:hypothetical protein